MSEPQTVTEKQNGIYTVGRIVCLPICKLLFRTTFINKNNLPLTGKYILCSNHLSYLDPVLLCLGQKRKIYFMAKKELFDHKLLAWIIRKFGAFPVSRGVQAGEAINYGEKLLSEGKVMGIFYEGTRSKTGKLLGARAGAALIAAQTMTPVVPVCITAQGEGRLKPFRKTRVTFGEPISPEELGLTNGNARGFRDAAKILYAKIEEMRKIDLEAMGGTK